MTGWADLGLVALGSAGSLLGGALEARRTARRDRTAAAGAAADAAAVRELALLVDVHESVLEIWPDAMAMMHEKSKPRQITEFAVRISRVKSFALRIQQEDLRKQVRAWVYEVGSMAFKDDPPTDEQLSDLSDELMRVNEAVAERIRQLEAAAR